MRIDRSILAVAAIGGLVALAAACSAADDDDEAGPPSTVGPTFPGVEWANADPAAAGFDPAELDQLAEAAAAARSECLVVVRDGNVVADHRWPGPDQRAREAFSVTKSLTSTLVGIAQDRGDLDIDDLAADHIPEWVGTDAADVTVEDLLSNTSGRHWDRATDYGQMAIAADDKTAFAIGLGQDAPPGEVWAYNNSAIQTLSAVLTSATGEHPSDFARTALFEPIGMADSSLAKDRAGNALTFMGLQTTCLDLARFGLLMLHDGEWDGTQVVSTDFVEAATRRSSSTLNAGYGYLWWVNHSGSIASPALATSGAEDPGTRQGQLLPGAPEDIFWALGFNDQVLAVVPDDGVVALRLGPKPPVGAPFGYAELTQGVLDALVPDPG